MHAADDPFEIRAARAQDALALAQLLEELGFPATADVVALRLAALARAGETVLVGTRDAKVLGFVTLHATPVLHRPTEVGRITALIVTREARGHGLGRALVAAAELHFARSGCALVEVTSNQALSGAHVFYERLGYELTSLRFRKSLSPPPSPPSA